MVTAKEAAAAIDRSYRLHSIRGGEPHSIVPTELIDGCIVLTDSGEIYNIYELYLTALGACVGAAQIDKEKALKEYDKIVQTIERMRRDLEVEELMMRDILEAPHVTTK
jgi:hypothetical protein